MQAPKRPSPRATRLLVGALILIVFVTGCSQTAVVLWTDVPEIVPAVETFNASQDRHVIEIVYEREIASALRLAKAPPDLVVGRFIENTSTREDLQPLDRLLRRELDADEFYPELLATGASDGRQYLLPVAFNLPLVYFASRVSEVGTPLVIEPQEMRSRAETFNAMEDERWIRLAYSPAWNQEFLYQYIRTLGFAVHEGEEGLPEWPFESVVAGVTAAREWLELNDGAEADSAFEERYLYDPQLQLVGRGRVAYGYERSNDFFSLSAAQRDDLGFRWFGSGTSIHVLEDIVYAGIPNGAKAGDGARAFLRDFFTVDRQVEVVESALRKRVDAFGVAGGFSSLWRLNEAHLADYYPEIEGMIPPASWLEFPAASPRHWGKIVTQVVEPWLMREVKDRPQTRDLEASVRAWLLQQED